MMETLAYIHLALVYEAPESMDVVLTPEYSNLMQGVRQKWSNHATVNTLAIACSLTLLGTAHDALALQRSDHEAAVLGLQKVGTQSINLSLSGDVLSRGDRGPAVAELQNRLRNLNYFNGPMTGFYGSLTEAAVVRFQRVNRLRVDGKAGPKTWRALQNSAPRQIPENSKSPSITPVLLRGRKSSAVAALQNRLRDLNYFDGPTTSFYGSLTEAAVIEFQKANGLTPDGKAGPKTFRALQSSNQSLDFHIVPQGGPADPVLSRGDRGSEVEKLQRRLKELNYFDGSITGFYGHLTESAVTEFQRANGLSPNGKVGPEVLDILHQGTSQEQSSPTNHPSPNPSLPSSGTLSWGDGGQAVANLQHQLETLGYFEGPLTGFYGHLTESAVIEFQKAKGLTPDGKAGPKTIEMLQSR